MLNMSILHHIASNIISEININQRNPVTDAIVITILEFTYIWYYNIVATMALIQLSIAYLPW